MAAALVPPLAFYQSAVKCSSHHIPRHFHHFLGSEFRERFAVSVFLDTYLSADPLHSTHHQDLTVTFQANSDSSDSFWSLTMQLLKWQQWLFISSSPLSSHHSCYFAAQVSFYFWTPLGFVFQLCLKINNLSFSVCLFILQNGKIKQGFLQDSLQTRVSTFTYSHSARVQDQPDLW